MALRRLNREKLQQIKDVTAECQRNLTDYLNNVDEALIQQTPVASETQLAIYNAAETAVRRYEKVVDTGSKELDGFQTILDKAQKQVNSDNIVAITKFSDAMLSTRDSVNKLGMNLQSSGEEARVATKKVVLLQQKPEISEDLQTKLQSIVVRYENKRDEGERVTGAVSEVIQSLLAIINELDTQKKELQRKAANNTNRQQTPLESTGANNSSDTENNQDDFDDYANNIEESQKINNYSNKRKRGRGVTDRAAEVLGVDNDKGSNNAPVQYEGVVNNVQRVPLDFKLTPKLAKYVTGGNCYERYTVMMRLTDLLLQKVDNYLKANGEALQKIAWDEHDHLYFNNYAFDFNMINDGGGARQLGIVLENDLQGYFNNNEWGKLFVISARAMHNYCENVGVLDFANVEQYNEFIRVNVKVGFFGLNTTNIAKVCKKLQGRGMLALSSIRLNGLDIAYHDNTYAEIMNYDTQIANATTQEEFTAAYNNRARAAMQVPDMNIIKRVLFVIRYVMA